MQSEILVVVRSEFWRMNHRIRWWSRKRWDTHTTIDPETRHRGFTLTTNFSRLLQWIMIWKVVKVQLRFTVIRQGILPSQCNIDSLIPLKCSHYLKWLQVDRSLFSWDNSLLCWERALCSQIQVARWCMMGVMVGWGWMGPGLQVGSQSHSLLCTPHHGCSLTVSVSHSHLPTLNMIPGHWVFLVIMDQLHWRCAGSENEFRSETSTWLHLCCGTQTSANQERARVPSANHSSSVCFVCHLDIRAKNKCRKYSCQFFLKNVFLFD